MVDEPYAKVYRHRDKVALFICSQRHTSGRTEYLNPADVPAISEALQRATTELDFKQVIIPLTPHED